MSVPSTWILLNGIGPYILPNHIHGFDPLHQRLEWPFTLPAVKTSTYSLHCEQVQQYSVLSISVFKKWRACLCSLPGRRCEQLNWSVNTSQMSKKPPMFSGPDSDSHLTAYCRQYQPIASSLPPLEGGNSAKGSAKRQAISCLQEPLYRLHSVPNVNGRQSMNFLHILAQ